MTRTPSLVRERPFALRRATPPPTADAAGRATPWGTLEKGFVLLLLVVYAGAFWPLNQLFHVGDLALEGFSPLSRVEAVLTALFLAVAGLRRRREILPLFHLAWPILALVALAVMSALWSDTPDLVLRRSLAVALSTLFALYLFRSRDVPAFAADMVRAFALLALASLVVMAIAPGQGIDAEVADAHAWRGIFTTKNNLGWAAALGTIFAASALFQRYCGRFLAGGTLAISAALLLLSQSRTALLLVLAAAAVALLGALLRRRSGASLFLTFLLAVAGCGLLVAVAANPDAALAPLDRSAGLTGRTDLWNAVIAAIGEQPWLGYGFGSFWRSDAVAAQRIWSIVGWQPPHAHNGWLELGLGLGLTGVAIAALLWLAAWGRAFRLLVRSSARHIVFCLAVLTMVFMENLTEAGLFRATDLGWLLFVYVFLHLKSTAAGKRQVGPLWPQAAEGRRPA